eukprot:CAMPEP_0117418304 /NCGR_PEP_ID=MMETSP0758-20121206/111_1 /TAXON_ID=63605 /ORGANISM="Percolomonas cosmopolitus, Strain AE-1 (ATCC 50343)" /LENGTH=1041 /DNA_ID=CAMNT_0005198725 /DNA_START=476 /DNA_END=3602 /DNA_ORIENTATION=-
MTDLEIAKEKAKKQKKKQKNLRNMTKDELEALNQLKEDYNKLSSSELELVSKEAVTIQCAWRRFYAKKQAKKSNKRRYQRQKCATELLETEIGYVKDLTSLVNYYIEPMYQIAAERPKVLKKADLDLIFGDLPLILKVNKLFLEGCQKELSNYSHFGTTISNLFSDIVHYFKLYTNYCNNYDRAMKKLKEIRKNKAVNQIVGDCAKDQRHHRKGWAISTFLILPIQRIPRYRLLIRDLLEQTDKEHPDYNGLIEASKNIDSVADHLNITMKSNQMKKELSEMQSRFNFQDEFEFVLPHRHFIKMEEFKDSFTLHLFNDICILSVQNKGIFNVKVVFPLDSAVLFNWHNSTKKEYLFKIKSANAEATIKAKTQHQKQKWLTDIYMAMDEHRDSKGSPEVLVNEDKTQTALAQAMDTELNMTAKECVAQIKDNVHVLLKFGRQGKPHYRNFQLSRDGRFVCWLSKNNKKAPTTIPLIDKEKRLSKLILGQKTDVFKQSDFWRRADKTKTSLSFSIIYKTLKGEKSLDLVATNRKQYLTWITALQFILDPRSNFHLATTTEGPVVDISKLRKQKKMKFKDAKRASKNDQMQKIGDLYAWGSNASGGLGINSQEHQLSPIVMQEFLYLDVSDVFVGNGVAFATMTSGVLFSWGNGDFGKSGHGDTLDRLNPTMIPFFKENKLSVKYVAMGENHTLVLTKSGRVYAFGAGKQGQLGLSPEPIEQQLQPTIVEGIKRKIIVSIACGAHHSAALTRTGELYLWGMGVEGQLGNGSTTISYEPIQLQYPANVTWMEVACGTWHTLALTDKGHLYAWGDNSFGQCGILPSNDDQESNKIFVPRVVPEFCSTIVSLHCGHAHSIVLNDNGILFAWGFGNYGQLGDGRVGANAITYTPKQIHSLQNVRKVVCGFNHTIALTQDNKVFAWGNNTKGRLGLKTEMDVAVPTEIVFFEKRQARAISAGYLNSFAVCAHQWVPDSDVVGCMKCSKKFTISIVVIIVEIVVAYFAKNVLQTESMFYVLDFMVKKFESVVDVLKSSPRSKEKAILKFY